MLIQKVEHFLNRSPHLPFYLVVRQISFEYPIVVHPVEADDGELVLETEVNAERRLNSVTIKQLVRNRRDQLSYNVLMVTRELLGNGEILHL